MTGGKIYIVWCQPYDGCAQDIKIFTDKYLAEDYVKKGNAYLAKEHIPAVEEMTEAFVIFPANTMPFNKGDFECK